jgi:hypothetical protein
MMARVRSIEMGAGNIQAHRTEVDCQVLTLSDGRLTTLIQLDTFGSDERAMPGKKSQTMQFDRQQARQLWEILGREFGFASE